VCGFGLERKAAAVAIGLERTTMEAEKNVKIYDFVGQEACVPAVVVAYNLTINSWMKKAAAGRSLKGILLA